MARKSKKLETENPTRNSVFFMPAPGATPFPQEESGRASAQLGAGFYWGRRQRVIYKTWEEESREKFLSDAWRVAGHIILGMLIGVIVVFIVLGCRTPKASAELTEDQVMDEWRYEQRLKMIDNDRAINAIIGEAENQGYMGQLYVACAIRNRGTLKGVYGENAPRVLGKKYSDVIYLQAETAWKLSATSDSCQDIKGATHWENIKAFGTPYWAKKMHKTFQYLDHVFYAKAGVR